MIFGHPVQYMSTRINLSWPKGGSNSILYCKLNFREGLNSAVHGTHKFRSTKFSSGNMGMQTSKVIDIL